MKMTKVEPKKVFLVAPLVWALFIFQQAESLSETIEGDLSEPAYQLLAKWTIANRKNFYVYQNADSGFNHGFPSGFFGATSKIDIDKEFGIYHAIDTAELAKVTPGLVNSLSPKSE